MMIQHGREFRGLTQSELSKRSGISPSRLSRFENHLLEPTEVELSKIASALDLPVTFFRRNPEGSNILLDFRKRSGLATRKRERLIAVLSHLHHAVNVMFRGLDLLPAFDLHRLRTTLDVTPKEAARQTRRLIGNVDIPIANMSEVIEAFGIVVFPIDLTSILGESFMQFDGATVRESYLSLNARRGVARDVIFINARQSGDRQRFTLAHELAHALLHLAPTEEAEQEANDFASEFLAPSAKLPQTDYRFPLEALLPLKLYWRVSVKALLKALHKNRSLDDARYRSLLVRYSQLGWQQGEPHQIDSERPYLLESVVKYYMTNLGYSPTEIIEVAGFNVGSKDWSELFRIDLDPYSRLPKTKIFHLADESR